MDIFLNQPIQYYLNTKANLHHLTSHSTPCCPTTEIVLWPQITVTSPHLMYSRVPTTLSTLHVG